MLLSHVLSRSSVITKTTVVGLLPSVSPDVLSHVVAVTHGYATEGTLVAVQCWQFLLVVWQGSGGGGGGMEWLGMLVVVVVLVVALGRRYERFPESLKEKRN